MLNKCQTYMDNRKIANDVVKWYFDHNVKKSANTSDGPKLSESIWADLLIEAISSFNKGLEQYIDQDDRRASVTVDPIVDMVGSEAFNIIAFLVAAQGTRRPIDTWGQASTIYTQAMSLTTQQPGPQAQKQLHDMSLQLQELSKTQGLDPETSRNIAGLGAEVQEYANKMTAYSGGGQVGVGGMSDRGMPTGVSIQGQKIAALKQLIVQFDDQDDDFYSTNDFITQVNEFLKREFPNIELLGTNTQTTFLGRAK